MSTATLLLTAVAALVVAAGVLLLAAWWRQRARSLGGGADPPAPWILVAGLGLVVLGAAGAFIFIRQSGAIPLGPLGRRAPAAQAPDAAAPAAFSVIATSPRDGATVPRNAAVRVFFSQAVRLTDGVRLRTVAVGDDGSAAPVPGSYQVENEPLGSMQPVSGSIVFRPYGDCGPGGEDKSCFVENRRYRVELDSANLKNFQDSSALTCSTDHPCAFSFFTNGEVDTHPPAVALPDQSLPISDRASLTLQGQDDHGLSYLRVTLDRGQVDPHPLGFFPVLNDQLGPLTLNLTSFALTPSSRRFLTVEAYDLAEHRTTVTGSAAFYPAHCFNREQDTGETGADCGGPACPACPTPGAR